jgi:hypothetical protein
LAGRSAATTSAIPRERFLPTRIGVNADRFAPRELETSEIERFGCDVSYVGHASQTADAIVADAAAQQSSADGKRLITEVYDRIRALYDAGDFLSEVIDLKTSSTMRWRRRRPSLADVGPLIELFHLRVNNALFRHQTLAWLAALDVDLRIYGKGWENHPTLSRFARGVADNQSELAAIYRASRINIQATPHGAVHQRLTDGLSAGGFFLVRYCPSDVVEGMYRPIWEWCVSHGVRTDEDLKLRATPEIQKRPWPDLAAFKRRDPFTLGTPLVTSMALAADGDYTCSAGSIWPEYERVRFDSLQTAREKVSHFLAHLEERAAIAASMRQRVLDRLTYSAITRRLLHMIAGDPREAGGRRDPDGEGGMIVGIDTNCVIPGKVGGLENYVLALIDALQLTRQRFSKLLLITRPGKRRTLSRFANVHAKSSASRGRRTTAPRSAIGPPWRRATPRRTLDCSPSISGARSR